jgi:hypothetical protein
MNHPTEEQFILYYYGEDAGIPVGEHITTCEDCRLEYRNLQRILNTVATLPVPERPADYGSQVWNRLQPQIGGIRRGWWTGWFEWRRLALASGMLCVVLLAFMAGRYGRAPVAGPEIAAGPVRERILLVAVGQHLERSQMVLAELANTGPSEIGGIDISYEQRAAQDLVESNRLYRQSAVRNGDTATATVLDELERVLMEIAHSPSTVSSEEFGELQRQIEEKGILFKVRVYATRVRESQNTL